MVHLKHKGAASTVVNIWEYDPARRLLIASVRFGNTSYDFEILVCSTHKPVPGAFLICQRSSDTWELTPGCFEQDGLFLTAKPARVVQPFSPMSFMLTHTPPALADEFLDL